MTAPSPYMAAKAAYEMRNAIWEASAQGIAYREKCRKREADNRAFDEWLRSLATPYSRSVEERIAYACSSWIDVEEQT